MANVAKDTVQSSGQGREELVYHAKLAEQAERYDEMAEFMKQVAMIDPLLSTEERNLLSVAYKNAVGARRASWRVISSIEQKQKTKGNEENVQMATEYKKVVERELMGVCRDILDLLETCLVPKATTPDTQVFFYKMRGDYYRYIAEFAEEKEESAKNAQSAYEEAYKVASGKLPPTHPIYLGLALNFSVFHYEIKNDPTKACTMAQKAFDDAIKELDSVSEENYRDSTLIMQLLRDNLTLWTSDVPSNSADGPAANAEGQQAEWSADKDAKNVDNAAAAAEKSAA